MADWFAVYRESDGKDISYGTVVADPLRRGLAKKRISGSPRGEVWNPVTLELEPKPSFPPRVDRVEEVLDKIPNNGISPARLNDLRIEIAKMLGPHRFRNHDEPEAVPL